MSETDILECLEFSSRPCCMAAHAEITRLQAERERLRGALERHHRWHCTRGEIHAAEYRESNLYADTRAALAEAVGQVG